MSLRVPPDVPAPVQNVEPRLLEWLRIMRNALAGTMRQVEAGGGGGTGPAGPAGGTFPDAVSDSKTYGRRNAAWNEALPITGGTLTGALNINPPGGAAPLMMNTATVANALWIESRISNVPRWTLTLADGTAETGSGNAGSGFTLDRYADGGGYIDSPLTIPRSTGIATFSQIAVGPTPTAGDNSTKQATTAFVTTAVANAAVPGPSTVNPLMNGTAAVGTSLLYTRQDHVHASDTSRAPLASPAFTGTPSLPTGTTGITQTAGNSSTALATTAFVGTAVANAAVPGPATVAPLMNGVAAVGTSLLYARQDHVHASDTSRAALASPTFTGTPTLPTGTIAVTQTAGNSSTAVATTAFVATSFAPLASPTFTGTPSLPTGTTGVTQAVGDSSTKLATTAFVRTGTTLGTDAAAGVVGEVISSNITSAVTLSNGVVANITSISLTAGDWDVSGEVWFSIGTGGANGGAQAGISTTTAALPGGTSLNNARNTLTVAMLASNPAILPLRPCRASLSSTTTYFLVAACVFPSGTTTATGNIIARRMR